VAGLLEQVASLAAQHEHEEDAEREDADEGDGDGEPHPETVPPGDGTSGHLTPATALESVVLRTATRLNSELRGNAPHGGARRAAYLPANDSAFRTSPLPFVLASAR
jgi:hypothetical protein